MRHFFKVTLRTSDVDGAQQFYRSVLGEDAGPLDIVKLHEQAVARGARPHWLGMIEVDDVAGAAAAFIARGAVPLGPRWVNPEGLDAAVLRDPGGAIVAVAKPAPGAARAGPEVVWQLLNTSDVERARENYGELFGWEFHPPLDLGPLGIFHPFSFRCGAAPIGSMSALEGRTGVHPHWLFHFRVAALDEAIDAVRSAGGRVLEPINLPNEERLAICDDPQGAAFAIRATKR